MKPYPLASLNHFTFPLITIRLLQSLFLNPTWTLEKTRRSESCQAGFLRCVEGSVQLAIPQEAADVAARLRIRNQLDEAVGIGGPGALEPAAHRNPVPPLRPRRGWARGKSRAAHAHPPARGARPAIPGGRQPTRSPALPVPRSTRAASPDRSGGVRARRGPRPALRCRVRPGAACRFALTRRALRAGEAALRQQAARVARTRAA